jgi:hypothetical protein
MKPNYTLEQLEILSLRKFNKPYSKLNFIEFQLLTTI